MSGILEYKCPCCGGAIQFNSATQNMKCPYCGTEFEMDALEQFKEETGKEDSAPSWKEETISQNQNILEDDALSAYICESCGGEIIADAAMAACSCPYCGNPVIIKKQVSGMLRPDLVIPFQLDQKAAVQKLKGHLKGKALLPSLFKSEHKLQEIRGIYVPFWLYDCETQADISCRATRTRVWRQGDYENVETQHYLVNRSGRIGFERVPADASSRLDEALMQSLEPFRYEAAVPFETAYLAGYLADRYEQDAAQCAPAANARIRQSTEDAFMNTITGYETCIPEHTRIHLDTGKITYALLPVWVLNTVYRGKKYIFAMNGQTGKFVGNLPADKGKAAAITGGAFALAAAAAWLITSFF